MQAHHAADIDDPSVPLAHHQFAGRLAAEKGPLEIGVDHFIKIGFLHAKDQFVGIDTGVIDKYIQTPEGPGCLFHQVLALRRVGNIRLQYNRLYPKHAAFFCRLLCSSRPCGVVDAQVKSRFCQCQANSPANTTPTAGHKCRGTGVLLFTHAWASFSAATVFSKSAMVSIFIQVTALPTVFLTKPLMA